MFGNVIFITILQMRKWKNSFGYLIFKNNFGDKKSSEKKLQIFLRKKVSIKSDFKCFRVCQMFLHIVYS
jgi:hypothetical protein